MAFEALWLMVRRAARAEASRAPPPGNSQDTVQRLQVGLFGLGSMVLLVGLANIIMNSAEHSQATAVPEAAPTVVPSAKPAPAGDPLADAGVVPDLAAETEADRAARPAGREGATAATASPDRANGAAARR